MKKVLINMKSKLVLDLRRITASYLRAIATVVGGTQVFDAFGARGWSGAVTGLLVALIAPTLRAIETVAKTVDPDAGE